MPSFYTGRNGDELFVNCSRQERYADGEIAPSAQTKWAVDLIKSVGPTRHLTDEHFEAVDVLYEEGVCLSPYTIFKTPLHKDLCRRFNGMSDLGQELREALAEAGALKFMDTLTKQDQAQVRIERILAVFTMATSGLWSVANASLDFIHGVVDIFRTPDGADWNRELIGTSELTSQCLAQVIVGLASIFDDKTLTAKSRKYRTKSEGKNPSWLAFTYSKELPDPEFCEFHKTFSRYSKLKPRQAHSTIIEMATWLKEAAPGKTLRQAVSTKIQGLTFSEFLISRNHGQVGRGLAGSLGAARTISQAIIDWYTDNDEDGPMVELVSAKEHQTLVNSLAKLPKPRSSRSRPLPEKFIPLMKEILEGGPGTWVQTASNFRVQLKIKGRKVHRYCPVIPTLLMAMLEVPLRMGQLRRLDSGEGDVRQFNGQTLLWEDNTGPHSGYWADREGKPHRGFPSRGYAREIVGESRTITGLFVNSNKTGQPYEMPWYLPKLLKLLWELREWQEAHNPISGPVGPGVYLDNALDYSDTTRTAMPEIFPIARLFPTENRPLEGRTVTSSEINHAWCALLGEIQLRWNNQHPGNTVQLVEIHPTNKQPYRPAYNLHGFRVRGLTNLHRGGMPIELLSKLVAGHATLSMTLYYVDRDPIEVADIIAEAVSKSAEKQRRFIDDLRRMEVEEARQRTVSISETAIDEAIASNAQVQFCNVSIGICPYDGTRCADGGELRPAEDRAGRKRSIYGPVEPHSCILCRHFVSGPPWLNELTQYGTKLCEQRQYLAREETRINETVSLYEQHVTAGRLDKSAFENKFDQLQKEMFHIKNKQEIVENSIFNVEQLCNASIKLLDSPQDSSSDIQLIANERSAILLYEEISEFEQAARITMAGRVHQILSDQRVEDKRDRYLNIMLQYSGIAPPQLMANITPEHCRKAMDQYALFVLERVRSTEMKALTEGKLRFQDIGLEDEVRSLLDVSISGPIYLPESLDSGSVMRIAGSLE